MRTCGNCLTYRFGKCKNRRSSTYGIRFPSNSKSCDMHQNRIPFGDNITSGIELLGVSVYKAVAIANALNKQRKPFQPNTDNEYWNF